MIKICLAIMLDTMYSSLPCGFQLKSFSLFGGSVAKAREASELGKEETLSKYKLL